MIKIGLEFSTHDWLTEIERQRRNITDELAAQISREHPEIFTDQIVGDRYSAAKDLVKNYVPLRRWAEFLGATVTYENGKVFVNQ